MIRNRLKHEPNKRMRDRLYAIWYLLQGYDLPDLPQLLPYDDRTFRNWVNEYNHVGLGGLMPTKPPGRTARLTPLQLIILANAVNAHSPEEYHLSGVNWHSLLVRQLLLNEFNVMLSLSAITRWLHRLDLTIQRLRLYPANGDEGAQQRWKEKMSRLRARLGPNDLLIPVDEAMIFEQTTLKGKWQRKNHPGVVLSGAGHRNQMIFGALIPAECRLFSSYLQAKKATAKSFLAFLKILLKQIPNKQLYLILDRASIHTARLIRNFVLRISRLHLCFLPPCSPKLNPIERFWEKMRDDRIHNKYYTTWAEKRQAIGDYLKTFRTPQMALKTLCTFQF